MTISKSTPYNQKIDYYDSKDINFYHACYSLQNISSKLLFLYCSWVNPLLYKGSKKELEQSDLYEALDDDQSGFLGTKLEE